MYQVVRGFGHLNEGSRKFRLQSSQDSCLSWKRQQKVALRSIGCPPCCSPCNVRWRKESSYVTIYAYYICISGPEPSPIRNPGFGPRILGDPDSNRLDLFASQFIRCCKLIYLVYRFIAFFWHRTQLRDLRAKIEGDLRHLRDVPRSCAGLWLHEYHVIVYVNSVYCVIVVECN